jgi:DNA-binding FadR family transcriptional regulator
MASKPQRLYQIVAEQLAAFMKKERLKPGDRLPGELALSNRFGVSRTTIREAMLALEIAGDLEIRGGSGAYLRKPSGRTGLLMDAGPGPFELLNARIMVEGEVAAEAALHASNDDLARIAACFGEMRSLVASRKNAQIADREFHVLIAEAAKNAVLTNFVDGLWSGIFSPMFHNLSQRAGLHRHQTMTLGDHERILEALVARDPQAARTAMRTHLRHVQEILQGGEEPAEVTKAKKSKKVKNAAAAKKTKKSKKKHA